MHGFEIWIYIAAVNLLWHVAYSNETFERYRGGIVLVFEVRLLCFGFVDDRKLRFVVCP